MDPDDRINPRGYRLPPELLREVREAEAELRNNLQVVDGRYLGLRPVTVVHVDIGEDITGADLLAFLGPLTRSTAFDSSEPRPRPAEPATVPLRSKAGKLIAAFIKKYLTRIRGLICKKRGKDYPLTATEALTITTFAHYLVQHMGVEAEFAKALAASVLVFLSAAAKGSFCDVTEEKALQAILEATE